MHPGAMHQAAGDILQAGCEQSGVFTDGNNAADAGGGVLLQGKVGRIDECLN